ncbi:hypothetical protein VZT92_000050 [Zoarces viviparus]|uniref:Uncharacterized protein n=1 Tax=Zoarces viviparus TaxID=48416 RepID=A0AAW1G4P6_ZOAVI
MSKYIIISSFIFFIFFITSSSSPPPSLRQGVRIVPPDDSVPVEEVLLAVGEQVGHDELSFASRMNKAVVVFLKQEPLVHQLIESGVFIRDVLVQVSPLSAPSTQVTVSGVPPFIQNELLEKELRKFGKFASGLKTVSLGCKDPKLRHVQSLRRQLFMFLDSPTQTLEVSFRVKHGDGSYIVYASSGQLNGVGHKRFTCPQRKQAGSADTRPRMADLWSNRQMADLWSNLWRTSRKHTDLYLLEEINYFLDQIFTKSVKVSDHFSDITKFIKSVGILIKLVGFDLLDEGKCFRLTKHITLLRKTQKGKIVKKTKK